MITQVFVGPPTITTHPTNQSIIAGTSTTLYCEGTGKGSITYQWEASNIKEEQWMIVSNTSSTRLDLNNLEQSRLYRCVVSNEAGRIISNPAIITVLSKYILLYTTVVYIIGEFCSNNLATYYNKKIYAL